MADQSSFEKLASHIPVGALEDELDADRRRLESMRDRYKEIRSDLEDLNETIQRRERLLEAYKGLDAGSRPNRGSADSELSKPEIARRILWGSVDPLYPRQVRAMAVERGWLRDDSAAHNQLAVAMSKMVQRGRLVKGEDGRYSLPPRD